MTFPRPRQYGGDITAVHDRQPSSIQARLGHQRPPLGSHAPGGRATLFRMTPFDRIAAILDSDLPKTERWVMVVMARYDLPRGCYPSVKRIMAETGLSDGAVRGAIRSLKRRGLLVPDGYSNVGTKRYTVNLPAPSATPGMGCRPLAPRARTDRHPVPPKGPAPSATKEGGGSGEEGDRTPPPTPPSREGRIQRMVRVALQHLDHWPAGWDPDDPASVKEVATRWCKANSVSARRSDVEAMMRELRHHLEDAPPPPAPTFEESVGDLVRMLPPDQLAELRQQWEASQC